MANVLDILNKISLKLVCNICFILMISSCQELALQTQGEDRAKCKDGYEFKSITRKCESIVVQNAPPKATLDYISITEDVEAKTIELSFIDQNEDPPLGCDITSFSDTLDGDNTYPVSCFCDETQNTWTLVGQSIKRRYFLCTIHTYNNHSSLERLLRTG